MTKDDAISQLEQIHRKLMCGTPIKNMFGDVVAVKEPSKSEYALAEVIEILEELLKGE